jgi:hypothetical protein
MTTNMQASARKMIGIALLWAALASLVFMSTADGGIQTTIGCVLGFLTFAIGLSLFSDGMKRVIVNRLREVNPDNKP